MTDETMEMADAAAEDEAAEEGLFQEEDDRTGGYLSVVLDTLAGDLRDRTLERLRAMPKLWRVMSEFEQTTLIHGVENVSRQLVRRAVLMIAGAGHTTMEGTLIKAETKDGVIKTQVNFPRKDPHRHELNDLVGNAVLVVLADADQYMGERAPAKPDPDQPPLPIEGGTGDAPSVTPMRGRRKKSDPETE